MKMLFANLSIYLYTFRHYPTDGWKMTFEISSINPKCCAVNCGRSNVAKGMKLK